jgi:hypothetical protein
MFWASRRSVFIIVSALDLVDEDSGYTSGDLLWYFIKPGKQRCEVLT